MSAEAVVLNDQIIELPKALVTRGDKLARQAMTIAVRDGESYEVAAQLGRELKAEKANRIDFFKPIKRSIDASKQIVLDREKQSIAPLDAAMRHLDSQATAWRTEQQRIEAELGRQAEEAERKRLEKERAKEVKQAIAEGNKKLAKEIQAAPIVPQVTIESEILQVAGIKRRVNWKFRIINAAKVPREWCMPDEKAIGEFVREHKQNAVGKIPGIEVYEEQHTL